MPATMAAATLESTPPLMAATIRVMRRMIAARAGLDRCRPRHRSWHWLRVGHWGSGAQARDTARDRVYGGLDVGRRVFPPERQPQGPASALPFDPHREQYVARLQAAGGARGAR